MSAREEGTVKEHGKNAKGQSKWLVRLYLRTDGNGKRVYTSKVVTGTERTAKQELRRMLTDRDAGILTAESKLSVNEYLDKWLVHHKTTVRPRTFENDADMLRLYIRQTLGGLPLSKLRPQHIQEAYAELQNREQPIGGSTIRRAHAVLHHALESAVRWDMIRSNPSERVDLPKVQSKPREAMNAKEADVFLKACELDRLGVVFLFMLTTGVRPSEALGLKWSEIDWEKGTAAIRRTLHHERKGGGYRMEEATKTEGSARTVVMPAHTVEALRAWKTRQDAFILSRGEKFERIGLVFCQDNGKPIRRDNLVNRHYKPLIEHARLSDGLTLYGLRHTYATLALQAGVPVKVVSENLGHADIALTLRTYAHVFVEQKEAAAVRLQEFLFGA